MDDKTFQAGAIVIGVGGSPETQSVDPTCAHDAEQMAGFLRDRKFRLLGVDLGDGPIIGEAATYETVKQTVECAARNIDDHGTLVVYFSGHGFSSQIGDDVHHPVEGWRLYNGNVWDREWKAWLSNFRSGVRVIVISDSCFSGGMGPSDKNEAGAYQTPDCQRVRRISNKLADEALEREQERYTRMDANPKLDATVLLLAACQANQNACVGEKNGLFTSRLLDVAQDGPGLSYRDLYLRVCHRFRRRGAQSPFFWGAGPRHGELGYETAFSPNGDSPS
jgi:hypothetical protein